MTATTSRTERPPIRYSRPPRYRWVPIFVAVLLVGGGLWGFAMYLLASH